MCKYLDYGNVEIQNLNSCIVYCTLKYFIVQDADLTRPPTHGSLLLLFSYNSLVTSQMQTSHGEACKTAQVWHTLTTHTGQFSADVAGCTSARIAWMFSDKPNI